MSSCFFIIAWIAPSGGQRSMLKETFECSTKTCTPVQLHDLMHLEPGYKPGMTWALFKNPPGNPELQ